MMASRKCKYCRNDFAFNLERCPHCAQPGLFPNVEAAEQQEERSALEKRYLDAIADAKSRGCLSIVEDFQNSVERSKAVISCDTLEVQRLAKSENELYATFYELSELPLRIPKDDRWNRLRQLADDTLFSGYKKHIRFAALSLGGRGLSSYGECTLVLRDHMIAPRASVLEENSVLFLERHISYVMRDGEPPAGYRAVWADRAKLSVAKLATRIDANRQPEDFESILLKEDVDPRKQDFVEVHIWGPFTIRTVEKIVLKKRGKRSKMVRLKGLSAKSNVALEIV